MGHWTF